nr:4530_t:CDS:2 [Entrophospora candida]
MFPNYQNIVAAADVTNTTANVDVTFSIASGNNMKPSVSTPLLNDPSHKSNNDIIWFLERLEKQRLEINVDRNLSELNKTLSK